MSTNENTRLVDYFQRARACRIRLLKHVDPKDLHDFRTSFRHMEASLRLEKYLLNRKQFLAVKSQLKQMRNLTGPLREADAAAEILRSAGLAVLMEAPGLRRRREEAFQDLLKSPRFEDQFQKIEDLLEKGLEKNGARRRMRKAFWKEMKRLRKYLKAYVKGERGRKTLHQLRIQAKRIRYGLEQFEFLHPFHRKKLLKAAHKVHDLLGLMRDLRSAEKKIGAKKPETFLALENKNRRDTVGAIRRLESLVA